jgi:hypothetical protein
MKFAGWTMKFGGAKMKFSRLAMMFWDGRTLFALHATKPSL